MNIKLTAAYDANINLTCQNHHLLAHRPLPTPHPPPDPPSYSTSVVLKQSQEMPLNFTAENLPFVTQWSSITQLQAISSVRR